MGGRIAVLVLALVGGCRRDAAPSPAPTASASEPPPKSGTARPLALFSPDPSHPYNRLFDRLFTSSLTIHVPACAAGPRGGAACALGDVDGHAADLTLLEGDDGPVVLLRSDPRALREPERMQPLLEALDAVAEVPPSERPIAAALLQSDLWDRYDRLCAIEGGASTELLERMGKALRALALPEATLRGLPPNLPDAARALGPTLEGLDTGNGWLELTGCDAGTPVGLRTQHAGAVRHRAVVRVLVSLPEGREPALRRALARAAETPVILPPGTRIALLESPLGLSTTGEIVPLPLVTLIEARTIPAEHAKAPTTLADLPFEVFEARRARAGALERLDVGHLLPEGLAVVPVLQGRRTPFPAACLNCHHRDGAQLFTSADEQSLCLVSADPALQARWAVAQKHRDECLAGLRGALFR